MTQAPVQKQQQSPGNIRRRLEQYVNNPRCQANALSAIYGLSMDELCRREGLSIRGGISPFAFARGMAFEKALFEDQAERLIAALKRADVLPAEASGFLDLRLSQGGGPRESFKQAQEAFEAHLQKAQGQVAVIASPTFFMADQQPLGEGYLAADALILVKGAESTRLVIAEIKSYPDRGGYTDGQQLATARAQAGLYIYALGQTLQRLGLGERYELSHTAVLVLSKPNLSPNYPRVRPHEDLRFQVERAARVFDSLRQAAQEHKAFGRETNTERRFTALSCAAVAYSEDCKRFCKRARKCQSQALHDNQPAALGEAVTRLCGPVGLDRAFALLEGGAAGNDAERDFLQRVEQQQHGAA